MSGHIDQFFVGAPFRARPAWRTASIAPGRALLRGRAETEHGSWIFSDWVGRAVSSLPLWINRKLQDGGLGTARPTGGIPPQSDTPCGVRRLVAALPFSSLTSVQHSADKSAHSKFA